MLRGQYGTATPTSLVPVSHREDAQPNEGLTKQFRKLPPSIRSTAATSRDTTSIYHSGFGSRGRGNYSGGNMSQGRYDHRGSPLQYATRGNPAWRGRRMASTRGTYMNWNAGHTPMPSHIDVSSPSASSSSERTPSVGPRASSLQHGIDPGPSNRRTHSTAFPVTSETPATPPIPEPSQDRWWMHRSRSPTPKLPAAPLKRRKIDGQPETKPQATISRLPLPGRLPKPIISAREEPPVVVKQEPVHVPIKHEPVVKREPLSPSPPPRAIAPERKLITESCQFFPFPETCKKSDPNFKQNRKAFFVEKNKELLRKGLKRTRAFARDDGLVIEWTSAVPVWSDTLEPEVVNLATVIQRAYQVNTSLTHYPASVRRKKRAASHDSDSVPGPSQVQVPESLPIKSQSTQSTTTTKNSLPVSKVRKSQTSTTVTTSSPISPPVKSRPVSMKANASSRYREASDPPWKVPPIPRRRLPLPGRKPVESSESKPITVPVAFAPRRSITPISASTTTLANIMKTVSPLNLPSNKSTPMVAGANHSTIPPSVLPSGPKVGECQDLGEDHCVQSFHANERSSNHRQHPVTTVASESLFNATTSDSGAVIAHKHTDNDHNDDDEYEEAEDVANSLLTPSRDIIGSDDDRMGITISTDDDGPNEVEGHVADFLQRYCQLFDTDRSKLGAAYDKDALFSCYVHDVDAGRQSSLTAGLFALEVDSAHHSRSKVMLDRGRKEISARFMSMRPYQFCPRGVVGNLIYDAVDSPAGILLTVHGEIVNPHSSNPRLDHTLTLDQSFLLRKRGDNAQVHFHGKNDDDG
ncbi:hypothetical protein JR316_0008427 [Psilocybe cubensis]|uniref:Uncharacterized protein n=2 Tax=Psilocybe cubensis TaxID=181762 RepID=A0ACB8GWT8_PSICU|nr:hypothetical protein JR316_0008427 [Psilocybe cubensis]KAH9479832.1 hypothetical protein JR316_0008427 [Psilocybe cubensis]